MPARRRPPRLLKAGLKRATPVGGPKDKHRGNLRSSLSLGKAKRDKPGYFVRFKRPKGAHRHLVIQGTAERFTKKTHASRGRMTPNPFVARVADTEGDAAMEVAMQEIARALDL